MRYLNHGLILALLALDCAGFAGLTWARSPGFSAELNPAHLSIDDAARSHLGWRLQYLNMDFKPIDNVVVENSYSSDVTTDQSGSVDVDYTSPIGQNMGLETIVTPEFHNLALGFTFYLPLGDLVAMDTGEPFLPEYGLWRNKMRIPHAHVGIGAKLLNGVHAGVGVKASYSFVASTAFFLQTSQGEPSSMRLAATVKPSYAPYLGLLFLSESDPDTSRWSVEATIRAPVVYDTTLDVDANAEALSGLAGIPVQLQAQSSPWYEPFQVSLDSSIRYLPKSRLRFGISYEQWSNYRLHTLRISPQGGIAISASETPDFQFKDIVVPHVGNEFEFATWQLTLDYAYRPSILKALSTQKGNLLDPPGHRILVAAGVPWGAWFFQTSLNYEQLVTQTITKTSASLPGFPSYQAGGRALGAGLSVSVGI